MQTCPSFIIFTDHNAPVMTVLLLCVVALLPVEGVPLYLSLKETNIIKHQTDCIESSLGKKRTEGKGKRAI